MNIRGIEMSEIPKEIKERFEQWYKDKYVQATNDLTQDQTYNIAFAAYIEAIRMMCVDATAYEEYQLYCCFDKPKSN
jgi:hypothetical protein